MALFCGKCGTAMQPGTKFCPSCGAPSAQPAVSAPMPPPPAAPPPQQWAPAAAPPPQQQWAPSAPPVPAAAPPQKSGGALKFILIALGVIVLLIVVAIVGAGIFIKKTVLDNVSVKEGPGGKAELSINTPQGQLKFNANNQITEEKLGVPIYPGSKPEEGAGSVSIEGADQKGGFFGGATFTTTDSIDKVAEFYKNRLGNKITTLDTTSEGKHSIVLNVSTQNAWKTITLEDEGNGITKISVASITGNTPQ